MQTVPDEKGLQNHVHFTLKDLLHLQPEKELNTFAQRLQERYTS
jgi:hypothetical protein